MMLGKNPIKTAKKNRTNSIKNCKKKNAKIVKMQKKIFFLKIAKFSEGQSEPLENCLFF